MTSPESSTYTVRIVGARCPAGSGTTSRTTFSPRYKSLNVVTVIATADHRHFTISQLICVTQAIEAVA
jgi:hypothetical protein